MDNNVTVLSDNEQGWATEATDAPADVPMERFLPVKMTQEEWEVTVAELTTCLEELESTDAERKEITKRFKAATDDLYLKRDTLRRQVETQEIYRRVKCQETADATNGLIHVIRTDTGGTVETRKMTADERQQRLFC